MSENSQLWVDKYAPENLDSIVLDQSLKQMFKNSAASGKLTHVLLAGNPGIGKTTLAKVLAEETGSSVLFIPCAVEGTVDIAKTKLSEFCNARALDSQKKMVILDEIDSASATQDSSFQKTLRNIIESAQSDTVFVLTCNYESKVIPAIKSRCPVIHLSFTPKDLIVRLKFILDSEKIQYSSEALKELMKICFSKFYPDIRQMVSWLQRCCSSGKLEIPAELQASSESGSKKAVAEEAFKMMKTKDDSDLIKLRRFLMQSKASFNDDYSAMASELINYYLEKEWQSCTDRKECMEDLAEYACRMSSVIDPEIQLFAMCCRIQRSLSC